jgi:hypothetical protein
MTSPFRAGEMLRKFCKGLETTKGLAVSANPLELLEAATGFEPVNNGFAECLKLLTISNIKHNPTEIQRIVCKHIVC